MPTATCRLPTAMNSICENRPGTTIMIVLPAALVGTKRLVHYTLDIGGGQVRDVWILRPDEAAIRPWPATLEQANTWLFDPTTMTWAKP